jgi:hypothetical protein
MKVFKSHSYSERLDTKSNVKRLEEDLIQLFNLAQGRVRFGRGNDGDRGENISGEFQEFTSHGTANTEFSVTHGLGSVPVGRIIVWQDKAGHLYQGPSTGTAWTSTTVYFKSDVVSVTFKVFLLK